MSGSSENAVLERIARDARAAYPDLDVPEDVFVRWVRDRATHAPEGVRLRGLVETLEALHTEDLYLTCACVAGDARAIALFDARFLAPLDRALVRLAAPDWAVDETRQVLRYRFFAAPAEGKRSPLEDYSGRGTLKAWVSASAVHAALRVLKTPALQADADSTVMKAVASPGDDLELAYLKRRYAREFEAALAEAFASLDVRERNVLRCYHLEGGGIDGVAALYRVHRATASRWVKQITEGFLDRTRKVLTLRTHANRAEISSLLRLLESRIDAIVRTVLTTSTR